MPGETSAHRQLKAAAVRWARQQRFSAVVCEVRLPRSAWRVDVAAYRRASSGGPGVTAVFECKQSRADFLRDAYGQEATADELRRLDARRQKLEELLKLHFPSLRRGEMLFAEFDAIHLGGHAHEGYRRLLRRQEQLQRRLAGKTRFDRLRRYRCANLNYLVVPAGLLDVAETPVGWGLLEWDGAALRLARCPVWQAVAVADRLRLLENMAARAGQGGELPTVASGAGLLESAP